jgi:phage shock protein A
VSAPEEPAAETGEALERARQRRHALAQAADALEAALARPAGDAEAWRAQVGAALGAVDAALDDHVAEVEGPDGLYAEILERTPRLAHQIEVLRREHVDLRDRVAAIRPRLTASLDEREIERIREDSLELLKQISRHRHRGADLVFESYDSDIGGEGD